MKAGCKTPAFIFGAWLVPAEAVIVYKDSSAVAPCLAADDSIAVFVGKQTRGHVYSEWLASTGYVMGQHCRWGSGTRRRCCGNTVPP